MKSNKKISLLFPFVCLGAGTMAQAQQQMPNVIYIMADDMGIGDLGCYGQQKIKTPAIDRMAANGIRFTRHYSGSAVSAPSRCVLMTGKHTGHGAIRGNRNFPASDGLRYSTPLPACEITVAEIMKQAGYHTACFGKWGMGNYENEGNPNLQGFDYFYGYLSQLNAHTYYPEHLFENKTKVPLGKKHYSHDLIMNKALEYINKKAGKLFFIYLTPTIPHAELIVPEGELGEYGGLFPERELQGKQKAPRAVYAAMVSRLDRDIRRLVDLLKEKGIYENTLIVFTSDNGVHASDGLDPDFFDSNGPFRGIKRDLYEGGIRTPFVVQWPAVIRAGQVSGHISGFWDFLPTMCELAGQPIPQGCDGISYLPEISGQGKQKQHDHLYFELHEEGGKQAVIRYPWKLLRLRINQPDKTQYELYNLENDEGEENNLLARYPEKAGELKKVMQESRTPDKYFNFKNDNY